MNRRTFIHITATATGIIPLVQSCRTEQKIPGKIVNGRNTRGHALRNGKWETPKTVIEKDIVIIGSGISGLSAARHLQKSGLQDFVLLELEDHTGGNATYGTNSISSYPWGAHYVPIPNNSLSEYLDFLKESGVITGFNNDGLPIYNELHLCFSPDERLYINGKWQEGLIPQFGVPDKDLNQIRQFLDKMNEFRYLKTTEGIEAFAIPVDRSARTEELLELDKISMEEWLKKNGYTSQYLSEYVNYCCRDDFGTSINRISAWAGIHYFASRKGKGANAEHEDVLTWPEGNGFLVNHLKETFTDKIFTNSLATKVYEQDKYVIVEYADKDNNVFAIRTKQCILSVPQFVTARLLSDEKRMEFVQQHYEYSPWMVANLTVKNMQERSGVALSWDNVIHNSQSLGYVEATHQLLRQDESIKNITYYLPLTEKIPFEERKIASERTHEEWVHLITEDLKRVHPGIEQSIINADVLLWGHAMAQPLPGHIFGEVREKLSSSVNNKIHFAHTDLAGISIFEEGFYQGLNAARKIIKFFNNQ